MQHPRAQGLGAERGHALFALTPPRRRPNAGKGLSEASHPFLSSSPHSANSTSGTLAAGVAPTLPPKETYKSPGSVWQRDRSPRARERWTAAPKSRCWRRRLR